MTQFEELEAQVIAQRLIVQMLIDREGLTSADRAEMLVSARKELALNEFAAHQPFLQAIFDSFAKFLIPPTSTLPPWMTADPE
ncbi:hypothetical protein R69658_05410 [Paraburkholderia aspalathi]|uniref:Uncharacterized protein n=1 Tax=Paraburkholderia aspalathi TaxID=1324617 RepID=A0ABM8SHY3_9BURK|nr:hypothetical protein [Paraburkholderia aspalathi]MBK3821785.1 hypothetical protein [Paraburkholderia aspalathi]MBK3833611.1 hypothetical protein [Paraburkholderia aspalathi]MBK3863334.1 hypothetical protein [Paraburkholderia aspalathi]CAE6811171.1 hypothetical protein R69658_05410 [Paraburkholderia aspalathi]